MSCKWCKNGYYPAINVNGVVIHRTPPTMIAYDGKIVGGVEPIFKDGIEICTARGVVLLLKRK